MTPNTEIYDIFVIGGGINGAGIAADAASRGLKVGLCEQGDIGSATSSASTKLVHGGLRYLETYEFQLVRKALKESETLLGLAPHLIKPIDILIPHMSHHRPWLMIRTGLSIYNHLARRPSYKKARSVRFDEYSPLKKQITRGFSFSDGQVDDSRLVILNVLQAARLSADIFVRIKCTELRAAGDVWEITLQEQKQAGCLKVHSKTVVNATGPWVSQFVIDSVGIKPHSAVRLVKGSHIIVNRLRSTDQAFLLQNEDGRVVFVIPYLDDYSLIGTTEEEFSGDPSGIEISDTETNYLINTVNAYFTQQIGRKDIVSSFAGIRPLIDKQEASVTRATRDYRLEFEATSLPLLSIYGGKVTTYRILAQQAVDKLAKNFANLPASKTDSMPLPGAKPGSPELLESTIAQQYPWLDTQLRKRLTGSYGELCKTILAGIGSADGLGKEFGHGLFQCEVDYLVNFEWARTAADVLWRRTKLGLKFDRQQTAELEQYMAFRTAESGLPVNRVAGHND